MTGRADPLTIEEVDGLVKADKGWDVTKKHVERISNEITEHFIPYWHKHIKSLSPIRHDAFGIGIDPSVPEIKTSHINSYGNFVYQHHPLSAVPTLMIAKQSFGFDQRFLIVRDDPVKGYLLALRANGSWSSCTAPNYYALNRMAWHIDISGIKFLGERTWLSQAKSQDPCAGMACLAQDGVFAPLNVAASVGTKRTRSPTQKCTIDVVNRG